MEYKLSNVALEDAFHSQSYEQLAAAYRELEAEKQSYQALFKSAPDAYLLTDNTQLKIIDANEAAEQFFNSSGEFMVGKVLSAFIIEADQIEFRKWITRLNSEKKLQKYGVAVRTAAGTDFRANVVCWRINHTLHWHLRYVTEFPYSDEDQLYLSAVLQNSDDPIIGRTLDGVIVTWNRGAERVYGYKAQEALGKSITMLAPPGYEDEHQQLVNNLKRGERVVSFETKQLKKDGSILEVSLTASPIRDKEGHLIGLAAIAHDITECKWVEKIMAQAHNRVVQQRRQLRTVLAALPVGVLIADPTGRIVETNDEMMRILGGPVPMAKSISDYSAYKGWRADSGLLMQAEDWGLARALQDGETTNGEVIFLGRLDGTQATILSSAAPIRDESGQVVGGVAAIMDITAHRQAEQQAFAERERVRVMTDFVRDISHDFKTPLSTINTSAYLLQKIHDPDHQKQHILLIYRQTARLAQLLEGLLTMTRLDSDATFSLHPVALNRIVEDAAIQLISSIEEKNLHLDLELTSQAPLILADEAELERALSELVQNAVQFTPPEGMITVRTATEAQHAIVTVQDTGCGIDQDDLPYIFNRLYRVDKARSATTGGVGLGLAIAKKVIDSHNGRIEVESQPGKGSTFRVVFPMEPH